MTVSSALVVPSMCTHLYAHAHTCVYLFIYSYVGFLVR